MTPEQCDKWWMHRLGELEQHARDVANCRVAPLDGDHDDRYKFVHREMAYVVAGIRGRQDYIARLTSTVPPDGRPIVPRWQPSVTAPPGKMIGCTCPPARRERCTSTICPWKPT